jgi:CHAD domain-containing protein
VREADSLWKSKAHSLERARKALKRGDPEGLHDLRVALRRVSAIAGALGRKDVSDEARDIVRSLSKQRQLEVDRQLLARIGRLGFLSPDAVTALAARWEKLAARGSRRVARAADGRPIHSLRRRVIRLERKDSAISVARLERARRRAQEALAQPLEGKDDRTLHRYRVAIKKARYLAEDLATLGVREWVTHAQREKALQEALGRWNDLRLFRRRLAESRDDAEERGAVVLAAQLERLITALEPTVATVRRAAVEASKAKAAGDAKAMKPKKEKSVVRGRLSVTGKRPRTTDR